MIPLIKHTLSKLLSYNIIHIKKRDKLTANMFGGASDCHWVSTVTENLLDWLSFTPKLRDEIRANLSSLNRLSSKLSIGLNKLDVYFSVDIPTSSTDLFNYR